MNIRDVVNELGKNHVIENIVYKINRGEKQNNLKDLIQDIYLQLLTKNTEKIIELYQNKQLKYYITRIVLNNICSNTSPYFTQYKKSLTTEFGDLSPTDTNKLIYDEQ